MQSFLNLTNQKFSQTLKVFFAIGIILTVAGCDKDENPKPSRNDSYINTWILENMRAYYLWNDGLPQQANTSQDPETYFASLLDDEDRFSWIQENYEELLNSLQGINKESGFEFVLYAVPNSSDVIAQITYVKPASPAETAGLRRGDVISAINGTTLTTSNYRDKLGDLKKDHTLRYRPLLIEEQNFGPEATASLKVVQYSENPNYLFRVINAGDHKIGYYVYNFFATGPGEGSEYDDQMDDIFSIFKTEGITDLVLDFRFNSGGSEVSAKNLASLIAPNVTSEDLFFQREYNDGLMEEIISDPELGEEFLKAYFADKASNIGSQLSNNRVYILTSSRTASASELIINGLLPYMDVFLIGDVTYGKNVGSISIYEENEPRNTYGMQPIVVKVYNRDNSSDYSDGFEPNIENLDNDVFIYPLGDERESMLQEAIAHITGLGEPGRKRSSEGLPIIGHSLDQKRSSFTLLMEHKKK